MRKPVRRLPVLNFIPERAVRKVRWKRWPNGIPALGCSSCGWAKGMGHDIWCRYIAGGGTRFI